MSRRSLSEGTAWVEFDDDVPTRQVECFGERWFNTIDEPTHLTDQPHQNMDPEMEQDEISQEEFDAAWNEAMKRRTPRAAG